MTTRRALRLLFAIAALATVGCTTVPPSARGTLQKRSMQPPTDPLELAMDAHVHENREAQVGARYGRGASCGCN